MGDIAVLTGKRSLMRSESFLTMDDYANMLTLGNFPLFVNTPLRADRLSDRSSAARTEAA